MSQPEQRSDNGTHLLLWKFIRRIVPCSTRNTRELFVRRLGSLISKFLSTFYFLKKYDHKKNIL